MKRRAAILLLVLLLPAAASAAGTRPAETPAVDTGKSAAAGTTLMVGGESEVGLYLTPWQEEHADSIDPPPGLYRPPAQPLDPRGFARRERDHTTVDAWRRQQLENFR